MIASPQFQALADFSLSQAELHVVLLADDAHPAHVVREHIEAFCHLSKHRITVINPRKIAEAPVFDEVVHAVIVHYSIYLLHETYLPQNWREWLHHFDGVKVLNIEDEYQHINAFKQQMVELGFKVVLSALDSAETMRKVYSDERLQHVSFYSCLPGYIVPATLDKDVPPIAGRPFDIVYRGRTLPAQLGKLAHEKRLIGEQVQSAAEHLGLKVDISSDEDRRIYGDAWPDFLKSGKAMLGVEGGASIFDFDGTLAKQVQDYEAQHPGAPFTEIWKALLEPYEGNIIFRTITPKFFEAIATKTALVLYPGEYAGVLEANRHYIPLERDGSNLEEVARKLRDDAYLQAMVDRTYDEVLGRPELHKQFYISQIDSILLVHVFKQQVSEEAAYESMKRYDHYQEKLSECDRAMEALKLECSDLREQVMLLQSKVKIYPWVFGKLRGAWRRLSGAKHEGGKS